VVGTNGKQDIEFKFMNVGDIVLSEDVLGKVLEGELVPTSINGKYTYSGVTRTDPTEFPDGI
jgi:hypothetical protein